MPTPNRLRSRVSRETRQLLLTALLAIVALLVLARIRFPGQPSSPNPIPSLLSQISAAPRFENLAGEIAELQGRLSGWWVSVPVSSSDDGVESAARQVAAIRFRGDAALTVLRNGDRLFEEAEILASDRITGLTVIRIETTAHADVPRWMPSALQSPRYLMATVATAGGVSLRPVLVGSLRETRSPAWPDAIWSVPEGTDLAPSTFVFTTSGELAGVVVREPVGLAIVPWDIALAEVARILDPGDVANTDLRIEVRSLTPVLERATRAGRGVVVAWVDPRGPAAGLVAMGDVIESINGQSIEQPRDWEVASSRVSKSPAMLRLHRGESSIQVSVPVNSPNVSTAAASLGLTMRNVQGVGAAIVDVSVPSAAAVARLKEGDVITLAGNVHAPTSAQVNSVFRSAGIGEAILIAVTRGESHLVVGLVK
jgi:hypothetical protein